MRRTAAILALSALLGTSRANDQMGQWGAVEPLPVVPIHQIYLTTGKILMFGYGELGDYATLYDPATKTSTPLGALPGDIFCAGHSVLSDGTVLIAGGHIIDGWGITDSYIYNPYDGPNGTFYQKGHMAEARWYPTVTTLPDGRAIAVSGSIRLNADNSKVWATKTERFDPETGSWTTTTTQPGVMNIYYPFLHVLTNGNVLFGGSTIWGSYAYNPTTGLWSPYGSPSNQVYGMSSVSYAPDKVLKTGGPVSPQDVTGSRWAAIWNLNGTPNWTTVADMHMERREHDLTVLPDGTVLATGGSKQFNSPQTAVYEAELYNPATNSWTLLPAQQRPRSYHSSAFLLRDGRVMVGGAGTGGGRRANATQDELNYEIYTPAYLFKTARPANQPSTRTVNYAQTFEIATDRPSDIAQVSLIAPGAVTHGLDMNQRRVPLSFQVLAGKVVASAPLNANHAPPGPYLLFMVDSAGVPSIGEFIFVNDVLASQAPATADLISGTYVQSGVARLASSDNDQVVIKLPRVARPSAEIGLSNASPKAHISTMVVSFESNAPNMRWTLKGYDHLNQVWSTLGTGMDTSADSTKRVELTEYARRFLNPTNKSYEFRLQWSRVGASLASSSETVKIDRFNVQINK